MIPHQKGTQDMDIHLISTFTWLQLFICQIHHLQAKWTSVISGGAHGDSTLKEARKLKKEEELSYQKITQYQNVQFQNIINLNNGITKNASTTSLLQHHRLSLRYGKTHC